VIFLEDPALSFLDYEFFKRYISSSISLYIGFSSTRSGVCAISLFNACSISVSPNGFCLMTSIS